MSKSQDPGLSPIDLIEQVRAGGVVSVVRTVVPALIAAAATWAALRWGVVVPESLSAELAVWVAAGVMTLYYAAARWIERRWPAIGRWLIGLGAKQQPVYAEPEVAAQLAETTPAAARPETP